ncbi:free fatty acid receptor 4-like [Mya arenaria]|uniref:free fatty acid receptor 4-like n=1 Tax=Mya arenaria TaxID=6604 RepID=UPI0022DEC32C|nr:free fatty acid receptor 4-like [Mya arenaria]
MCANGPEVGHSYVCVKYGSEDTDLVLVFTFMTQLNREWPHAAELEAGVILTVAILSMLGNAAVLYFLLKSKERKNVTNCFVINLLIADLMYVLTVPAVVTGRLTSGWLLGGAMCSLTHYWLFVCGSTMIWTMTAISIDRYVNINVGISTTNRLSKWHIIAICVAIWLIGIVIFLPVALYSQVLEGTANGRTVNVCALFWPDGNDKKHSIIFIVLACIFDFVIPVLIINSNYFRIYKRYRNSRRAVENFNKAGSSKTFQRSSSVNNQKYRVLKTLVILVVAFLLMWGPLFIAFSLIELDRSNGYYKIPSSTLVWATTAAYANTFFNALLYGMTTKQLKSGVNRIRERFTTHVEHSRAVETPPSQTMQK